MDGSGSQSEIKGLVAGSRLGDAKASESLIATYRPYLRLLAGRRLPKLLAKRADGSDIVQQTLLDAVRGLPEFRGQTEAEFTAWMVRLLERNLLQSARLNMAAMRDVRRETPEHAPDGSAQLVWHGVGSDGTSPQNSVFRGEAAFHLAEALEQLPDQQRRAVELRYLEQLPLDVIARELEKTTAAVAGLIARGVEALRRLLPKELGEP
jgi:RNA polymerase sigma-70 factor (ECF subfamily)